MLKDNFYSEEIEIEQTVSNSAPTLNTPKIFLNNNSLISIIMDSIVTKSASFSISSEFKLKQKPCAHPKINSTLKNLVTGSLIRVFHSPSLNMIQIRLDDKLKKIQDSRLLSKMLMSFIYQIILSLNLPTQKIQLQKIENALTYFNSEDEDEDKDEGEDSADAKPLDSKLISDIKEFKQNQSFSGLESFLLNCQLFETKLQPDFYVVLMDKYQTKHIRMESIKEFLKVTGLKELVNLMKGEVEARAKNQIDVKNNANMFL